MTVSFYDLTVDPSTLVDADPTKAVIVTVRTNTGGAILDTAGGKIYLGTSSARVTDTAAVFSLPQTDGTTNPTDFQFTVDINYSETAPDGRSHRATWNSGWFSFTEDANLADIAAEQYVPPTWVSDAITTLQGYVDEAAGYLADTRAISEIDETTFARIGAIDHGNTTGSLTVDAALYALHEVTLTGNATLVPSGRLGDAMAVRVIQDATGGHTLDLPDVAMPDGWVFDPTAYAEETIELVRWASGWRGYVAAPGVAVTADAPTFYDTDGTISDTYTIPDVTGVVYKVSGVIKAPGTYPASGTVTVTASGDFGYRVTGDDTWSHAFSTAGYTTLMYDTFTGSDGTLIGHTPDTTVGGASWVSDGAEVEWQIASNKASYSMGSSYVTTAHISLGAAHAQQRVTMPYDLTTHPSPYDASAGAKFGIHDYGDRDFIVYLTSAGSTATITIQCDNAPTVVGTLTGHPQSGTLALVFDDSDLSIKIDDTEVATATLADGGHVSASTFTLYGVGRTPKVDSVRVEIPS